MSLKNKIKAALALAVFVVPAISFAQTVSTNSLQVEIQSLLAEVAQLQAQLASKGGSTTWCYTFSNNLRIGQSGSDVTNLQTALQKDGESVTVNGTFDDQTASAVTGFQQKYAAEILTPYGLTNGTGYAGKATRAKLNSLFGCGSTVTTTPVTASTSTSTSSVSLTVNGSSGVVSANSGSQITLAWNSSGVTSCTANSSGSWTGSENTSGTSLVTLPSVAASTGLQYSLTCATPSGGSVESTIQVNVQPSTTKNNSGFTVSPSVTAEFTQGGSNAISWSGGACPAGMPNSCVSLILENAQGSCYAPSAGTPCNVGFVPAPVNSPASGSFTWDAKTVCGATASYSSDWADCTPVNPGLYRILAQDANGNLVSSGDIWINAATATTTTTTTSSNPSSITITSPASGQTWTAGTTQTITWTSQGISGYIGINLNNLSIQGESSITQITENLPSTAASFNWTIPSGLTPGQYEVQVWADSGAIAASQPFNVIASTVSPSLAASGRDAQRIANLRETQNMLELYYSKCGFYPGSANCAGKTAPISWPALGGALTGTGTGSLGISSVPNDPSGGATTYAYGVSNSGANYLLEATFESSSSISTLGGSSYIPPTIPVGMIWTSSVTPTCTGLQYCITL